MFRAMANNHTTVVFDLDGTLVDSAPDLAGALNALLREQGLPDIPAASIRDIVGDGAVKMIERGLAAAGKTLDGPLPGQLRERYLEHYRLRLTSETRPFPGVIEVLEALSGAGSKLAVCTNKFTDLSQSILAGLDLSRYFDAVVGGDSLSAQKPDAAPLRAAITRAGGEVGRAVMVGDSITDVGAARAAGVPVILVSFGYSGVPARTLGADLVIDHFDQLLGALDALARP
jgi:phosphoglycolate phosphatase